MHFSGGQIAYVGGQSWVNNLAQTNPVPQNLNSWTASVWVNYSSAQDGSWLPVFGTNWYSPYAGTLLMFNPSSNGQVEIQSWVTDTTGAQIVGNWEDIFAPMPANQWNLLTETVTAGQYNLYVNGVDVDSLTTNPGQTPLFIEPSANLTFGYFSDTRSTLSVNDFRLYGSVLTGSQVTALYNTAAPAGTLPATTPVELNGGATFDLAGNNQTVASLSDGTAGGGTVTNSGAYVATLTLAPATGSTTFSGVIQDGSGPTALTLDGNGTQVLAGANTYSGLTTITEGTLQIGTGGSINGSSGVVNNGLLAFNLSGTATFLPPVSGSGGLTQMGPGLVALGGVNTYTGPTIISGGTLSFATLPSFGSEIARYAFDGPLGSIAAGTAIPDATGNHPGIMVGNGASYAPGVFGQSLQLAGSTGTYVSVPYSSAFSNLTNFTVSSWVYFPANGGGAILNTRGGGNYGMDEYVRANGDGSNFTVNVEIPGPTNWSVAVGPSAGAPANNWYMVTTTAGPSGYAIYVDGNVIYSARIKTGSRMPSSRWTRTRSGSGRIITRIPSTARSTSSRSSAPR